MMWGNGNCHDLRVFGMASKKLFIDYRLTFIMICATVLNMASHHIKTVVVPQFAAYPHLTDAARQDLAVRCMQLLLGTLIATTGYASLLFHITTGCNVHEIFGFFLGGCWLIGFDLHEYVTRWPLPLPLLVHHVTVALVGLAVVDWQVIQADPTEPIHWRHVLFLANIGAIWVSDFFHAIYRTNLDLRYIQKAKLLYLASSSIRICSGVVFGTNAVAVARSGTAVGGAMMAICAVAYLYNTLRAVQFVYHLDCPRYYATHQATWPIPKGGSSKKVV